MKIQTSYWLKPIPTDKYDWEAVDDNYEPGEPIGRGATEREAIDDLLTKSLYETHKESLLVAEAEIAKLTTELERVKERRCMYNDMRKENLAMARRQLDDNINLTAERDAAIKSHCGTCDGSGVIDSGGVTPWDAPIDIACPECKAKRDIIAAEVAKRKGETK